MDQKARNNVMPNLELWKSMENSKKEPTGKPHKFFDRYLDNDLEDLSSFLQKQYDSIEKLELSGITEVTPRDSWLQSQSVSTMKWREYNVFQFYHPGIHNLYKNIVDMVKEACNYYEINFDDQQYMIQGWFNINYNNKGKLDWHDHGGPYAPYFHGYYSVKAEPSKTHYRVFNQEVENNNKDNRAILSEMGHPHAMAGWDWEGPRITIAYDVVPLNNLLSYQARPQHWFPLS
jgi:hypothetical protein